MVTLIALELEQRTENCVNYSISFSFSKSHHLDLHSLFPVPVAPKSEALLSINSSSVTIHLTSWQSGGCNINFFAIQYRPLAQPEWVLLSSNVLPEQKTVTVTDLAPASHYKLLMTAHNDAGTTEAEYQFSTLTMWGG